jgi:hypothetical protein
MTSTFYYMGLSAISAAVGIYAIHKKGNAYKLSTLVVFWLFTTSVTWMGEFTVLGLFNSYAYKPGISADPWAENLAGHLFLNATMFPGAAILFETYSLRWIGGSLIVAYFIIAEYLFLKLGFYEQHWWNYWMSIVNTALFLILSRWWFAKIKHARHNIPRLLTLYFAGFVILHMPMPFLLLWMKQYFSFGPLRELVGNMYRSSILFIYGYHMIEMLLIVLFVCVLDKWYWKLMSYVVNALGLYLLWSADILILCENWKLSYTILLQTIGITIFIIINKYTLLPDG